MAKEKNGKSRLVISIVSVSIPILALVVGGVLAYGKVSNGSQVNTDNIGTLKEDGCEPAKELDKQFGIVEYRLDSIDKKCEEFTIEQKAMRKDSKDAFKEILERLPK